MNSGTVLRTILAIAISINTALAVTDVTGFENDTVNLIYKIVSIVINFIIVAINTYYNNDFTEEGIEGTQLTRKLKAIKKDVVFEDYDTEVDDE